MPEPITPDPKTATFLILYFIETVLAILFLQIYLKNLYEYFFYTFDCIINIKVNMSQEVFEQFKAKAENAEAIGGTIKFVVDGNPVHIDGTGETNNVSTEDKDADCTITVSREVLEKLRDGEINPMMAVMNGSVKIGGDMGLAMKIQSLLS